jgi:hypothetical protein
LPSPFDTPTSPVACSTTPSPLATWAPCPTPLRDLLRSLVRHCAGHMFAASLTVRLSHSARQHRSPVTDSQRLPQCHLVDLLLLRSGALSSAASLTVRLSRSPAHRLTAPATVPPCRFADVALGSAALLTVRLWRSTRQHRSPGDRLTAPATVPATRCAVAALCRAGFGSIGRGSPVALNLPASPLSHFAAHLFASHR